MNRRPPPRRGAFRRRSARAARSLVPALAVVLLLAGCGDQAVSPDSRADPSVYPAVTLDQASDVVEAVDEADGLAVTGRDVRMAAGRLTGPAAELLTARSTMDRRLSRPAAEQASSRTTRLVVPAGSSWPRVLLAVCEVSGVSTPVIKVLRAQDARHPFALWARPQMLPGATVPATAGADVGAPVLSPTASGLVMSPQDALARYAALLTAEGSGKASGDTAIFTADPLRAQTAAASAAERKATAGLGSLATAHTVVPAATLVLATKDGGAIVVGEIRQQTVVTLKKGSALRVTGDLSALVPHAVFGRRLVRTTVEVVVLQVPKAGSGTSVVSLIAADRGDVAVAGA